MKPDTPDPSASLTRHGLIPFSLFTCFALVYWVRVDPWIALAVGVVASSLYLGAPMIGRRSMAAFDRDAIRLLASGKTRLLVSRLKKAWGMLLFSPPALLDERRGMVALESGEARRAVAAYGRAISQYPEGRAPLSISLGAAHAYYRSDDVREAARLYRVILRDRGNLPTVIPNLAHCLARQGEDLPEAKAMIEEAIATGSQDRLTLILALIEAKLGHRASAKRLLRKVHQAQATEKTQEQGLKSLIEDVELAL